MSRTLRSALLATLTLVSASTAWGQEATGFELDDEPPPLPQSDASRRVELPVPRSGTRGPQLELGARGAAAQGQASGHALLGFTGGYRVLPNLSLGGYADVAAHSFATSQDCPTDACNYAFQRFGARAGLHLLHDFVVDPWLAAGIGAVHVSASDEPWRADFSVEVGVDVRPLSWLALGPYVSVARALDTRADYDGFSAVGGRMSVQFDFGSPTTATATASPPARLTARR